MAATAAYLCRIELRRHRRSWLALSLMVALVVGVVLTATAGAGRSRTAFDRYMAEVGGFEALALSPDPAALAGLEDVAGIESAVPMELPAVFPRGGGPDDFFPMVASPDPRLGRDLLEFPIVDGRRPDPTAPLEIAVGERTARRLGVSVGDDLVMGSQAPSSTDDDPTPGTGPDMTFEVVGVVRDPGDIGARLTDITVTLLTPAFREVYGPDVVGSLSSGAFLVLAPGAAMQDVTDALHGRGVELDTTLATADLVAQITPTMRAIATALAVFATVVALAGAVAVAQSIARLQVAAAAADRTLAAIGVSRGDRWVRLAAPWGVAVLGGTVLGALVSVAASPLHPIGVARLAEPDPGVEVDVRVLALGSATAALVGAVVVGGMAVWRTGRSATSRSPRLSRWGRAVSNAGAPTPVVSGLSLASGTPGSPGRAAIGGTFLGVLGVLAALIFGASVTRLREDPALYGWSWDATIEGAEMSDLGSGFDSASITADPDLAAVGAVMTQLYVTVDGEADFAMSVHDLKGDLEPVLIRGKGPTGPDEIALGRDSLARIGASLGDTVSLSTGDEPVALRVVGVVAFPVSADGGSSAAGVYVPDEVAVRMEFDEACAVGDSCSRQIAVDIEEGVDPSEIVRRYTSEALDVAVQLPRPPSEIERLTAVQDLPRYLAGFLAVLAAATVSFATATTMHRRRGDLAVLRVVGMTSRQIRTVMTVLVFALTAGGALLGSVVGVVVGRQVWRFVATSVAVPFAPRLPLLAVAVAPLAAIGLGQIVADLTRRAAADLPAAIVLRTE